MEDLRLSRMYARQFQQVLARRRKRAQLWIEERRTLLGRLVLVLLAALFVAGYVAHLHGRFSRLKTELKAMREPTPDQEPMPGGQEPVVLQRASLAGSAVPEFLSATLLPGRGMSLLQISALLPGKGEIELLAAPSLATVTSLLSGTGEDAEGARSLAMGAPVEVPWAGSIYGSRGERPGQISTFWRGHSFLLPEIGGAGAAFASEGGLLLQTAADSVTHNVMPDGGSAQATYSVGNFLGRWPSQSTVTTSAVLSSRAFEIKIVVRNEGSSPEPLGLGWMPHFAIGNGRAKTLLLHLPAEQQEQMVSGRASGKLLPVFGTALDFSPREGRRLGDSKLDETFTGLKTSFLDSGPVIELRDVEDGFGIRMTAMSMEARAIRIQSRPGSGSVVVGFQTNYDDPLSRVWPQGDDGGLQMVQPGRSLQLRVRLELFALRDSTPNPF